MPSLARPTQRSLANLQAVLGAARKHGLAVNLSLFVGWMSGFRFMPSWVPQDADMFADEALRSRAFAYAAAVAAAVKPYTDTMLAFEYGNEMDVLSVGRGQHEEATAARAFPFHSTAHARTASSPSPSPPPPAPTPMAAAARRRLLRSSRGPPVSRPPSTGPARACS